MGCGAGKFDGERVGEKAKKTTSKCQIEWAGSRWKREFKATLVAAQERWRWQPPRAVQKDDCTCAMGSTDAEDAKEPVKCGESWWKFVERERERSAQLHP